MSYRLHLNEVTHHVALAALIEYQMANERAAHNWRAGSSPTHTAEQREALAAACDTRAMLARELVGKLQA